MKKLIIMSLILILTFSSSCFYSKTDNEKSDKLDCFKLNTQATKFISNRVGSIKNLDSALYFNNKAYLCKPDSENILRVRMAIFRLRKDRVALAKTIEEVLELKDSIASYDRDFYSFALTTIYINEDEKKYAKEINDTYRSINKKYDSLAIYAKTRSDFDGYFERKILFEYYLGNQNLVDSMLTKYTPDLHYNNAISLIEDKIDPKESLLIFSIY